MTFSKLPFRITTAQACAWLAQQTGTPWSLARLIEHRLTPSVWLDYDAGAGTPSGQTHNGHALPLRIEGDARQLDGAGEVRIAFGGNDRQIVGTLRFLKKDLERLARKLTRPGTVD